MIPKSEILKLTFNLNGAPYCKVTTGGLNANGLQFNLNGAPWWGHSGGSIETTITGNVKRILKVDWPYVKTIINVEG
jgi:hypothetical protein